MQYFLYGLNGCAVREDSPHFFCFRIIIIRLVKGMLSERIAALFITPMAQYCYLQCARFIRSPEPCRPRSHTDLMAGSQ